MALNLTEVRLIERLIARAKSGSHPPRLLFLGYPDILIDEAIWAPHRLSWDSLPKRSDDVAPVWDGHGRQHLRDLPMVEAAGLFRMLGADVAVSEGIRWGTEDFVLDLNNPLPSGQRGRYDLVIDPGTLEHCFNIAQAFDNVDRLLKPGGYVYHQDAIAFPNHGFWSISPTAFFDFYEARGYELGVPYRSAGSTDSNGFIARYEPIDPFAPLPHTTGPMIGMYIFRKRSSWKKVFMRQNYPVQRCYSGNRREIPLTDFAALAATSALQPAQ